MKICFGCFEQYDDSFDICPHCGYAEGTEPELATYMRPGATSLAAHWVTAASA